MILKNSYTGFAKLLHWLMALVIFGLLALGLVMADMPLSPDIFRGTNGRA